MSRITIRVDDDDVAETLEEADNKSELVRDAVRDHKLENDERSELVDLGSTKRQAFWWMVDNVEGAINLDVAVTHLSQVAGLEKELIRQEILTPLDRKGLINVQPRMHDVVVRVPEVDDDE